MPITGPARAAPWRIVTLAGLLAGALDISFAFVFYGLEGASPALVLRVIASGVLGAEAFTAGGWSVALGAALHFLIAIGAAFIFWYASRRLTVLTRRPLLCGAAYGIAVYLVMHFIVLPLSRVHFQLPSLHDAIGELFSHIVLFGMVIALGAVRAQRAFAPAAALPPD
jgi:uncharacterized membrane protein YagU involved in acid resistance